MIMSTKEICKRGLSMTISLTLGNTPLPFGDGPVRDAQLFSQGGLGEAGLFPALRDKGADFLLIHGETSFLPQP